MAVYALDFQKFNRSTITRPCPFWQPHFERKLIKLHKKPANISISSFSPITLFETVLKHPENIYKHLDFNISDTNAAKSGSIIAQTGNTHT